MPGPLCCAAWLDELVPENGTALRTLHDADDDRRCDDEYAVDRFELAGWHVDASATRTAPECGAGKQVLLPQAGNTWLNISLISVAAGATTKRALRRRMQSISTTSQAIPKSE